MNPARSFGPAVIVRRFSPAHWVSIGSVPGQAGRRAAGARCRQRGERAATAVGVTGLGGFRAHCRPEGQKEAGERGRLSSLMHGNRLFPWHRDSKGTRVNPSRAMARAELGHHLRSIKPTKPSLGFPLTQHCLQAQAQPCRAGLVPPFQHTTSLHS